MGAVYRADGSREQSWQQGQEEGEGEYRDKEMEKVWEGKGAIGGRWSKSGSELGVMGMGAGSDRAGSRENGPHYQPIR